MKINTMLQVSRLQQWSAAFLLLVVCSILIFSEMPTWSKAFALMLLGLVLVYQRSLQKPKPRLVQLIQFDKDSWRWSLGELNRIKKSNIYEGRLIRVQGGWFVLILCFETLEKNKRVMQNCIIWRDQVEADDWRRLIVLARFWANDVIKAQH